MVINIVVERYNFATGWRVSVSLQILIGLVLALGSVFLYETPRYKVEKEDSFATVVLVYYTT